MATDGLERPFADVANWDASGGFGLRSPPLAFPGHRYAQRHTMLRHNGFFLSAKAISCFGNSLRLGTIFSMIERYWCPFRVKDPLQTLGILLDKP